MVGCRGGGGIRQSLCVNTGAPLSAVPFCSLAGDRVASRVPQQWGMASVPCESWGNGDMTLCWGHSGTLL